MNSDMEKREKVVDLIIGGVAVGVLVHLFKKWWDILNNPTYPPIIIKFDDLGGLELESESRLGAEPVSPRRLPYRYTIDDLLSKPEYLIYPESKLDFPIESLLKIWLQKRDEQGRWQWINEPNPQIQITRTYERSLEIDLDNPLSPPQWTSHRRPPILYEYFGDLGLILRFGKLELTLPGSAPIVLPDSQGKFEVLLNDH